MEESQQIDGKYYLEEVSIDGASSRGTCSPLPVKMNIRENQDGDLGHVQKLADEKNADERAKAHRHHQQEIFELGPQPEMIDDFIRNYFANVGLTKTLSQVQNQNSRNVLKISLIPNIQFQAEWFEMEQKGKISADLKRKVNTVYVENQELTAELARSRHELSQKQRQLEDMRQSYLKLRKERDYHKMHHGRLEQEKTGLLNKLKWTKNHYKSFPPALT